MPRHLENTILPPQTLSSEGVIDFEIPLRAQASKPIVVMVPEEKVTKGGIELPDTVASKYQPDYAVVFDPGGCPDSKMGRVRGCTCPVCRNGLKKGDLVAIKPYTGAWYTHSDFVWIPNGRMIKILGSVDDWNDNILAKVDL